MRPRLLIAWAVLCLARCFAQQTADFRDYLSTKPIAVKANFPGTCDFGSLLIRSDQSPGSNLYICGSTNNWVLQAGGTTFSAVAPLVLTGSNLTCPTCAQYGTASTPNALPMAVDTAGTLDDSNFAQDPTTGALTPLKAIFAKPVVVSYNAGAPNFDLSAGQFYTLTLTGDATATISNGAAVNGAYPWFGWEICQDGTGNHAFTAPAGFSGAGTISPTASKCTRQLFRWDGTNAHTLSPAIPDDTPLIFFGPVRTAPGTPPAATVACWADSTGLNLECLNASGAKSGMAFAQTTTLHQWLKTFDPTTGLFTTTQPAFTDISGTASAAQLPNPTASTLGGIESYTAVSNQWINAISTSGVPSSTQPSSSNLSDGATIKTRICGQFNFDGSGSAITNNSVTQVGEIPTAETITGFDIWATGGTITIDVLYVANSNGSPTLATITASATPALASGTNLRSTTLTGWTTSLAANGLLQGKVTAVSGATKASLMLECTQ